MYVNFCNKSFKNPKVFIKNADNIHVNTKSKEYKMSEFINGFNPNIPNYNSDVKKGKEENNNQVVENSKEEKGSAYRNT